MNPRDLLNPADPPQRQFEKLLTIVEALMRRAESANNVSSAAYAQFERAAMLEEQVRERTRDLERTLDLLHQSNARLAEASAETEAARQNLANAIETVQEGFALFDPQDVLVLCNARFGRHLADIRPALVPGLHFADYVALVSQSEHMAFAEDGMTAQQWAARRMARHRDPHVSFNVPLIWDRWLQVSEHRTESGGTVILQTDVTDIIRLERLERGKLLDDQARIVRATLDHISQGVCIFDAAARLVGWNAQAASLLAIPLARFRLGLAFDDLLARFDGEMALGAGLSVTALRAWVHGGGPRAPLRFEMRRGEGLVLDTFAQEIPERGFVVSFGDVTAERSAITALSRTNETLEARVAARTLELEGALANAERANAARTRFVAAASHDLLQPLSAAKLFVAAIEDERASPRTLAAAEKAQAALESVESILGALLDISRLDSGRLEVTPGPVALAPLLARLIEEFSPVAAEKGLRLRLRPGDATVVSDPAYLRRILQNLIGNALRYTEAGGVLVGLRQRGLGQVRVDVVDTGPGIPEAERENIFKEFHRLNARASASEGLGLGLAIVERAAAMLGHPLTLQSRLGRGTRFAITLPVTDAALAAQTPDMAPRARVSGDALIGLLVENDHDIRRALTLLLEGWGVSVLEASHGPEAMALIEEIGIVPDFMLIDSHLGDGLTGLQVLSVLTARHPGLPVRVITADRSDALREACARLGVFVIYKPIDTRALERFIGHVGERRRAPMP